MIYLLPQKRRFYFTKVIFKGQFTKFRKSEKNTYKNLGKTEKWESRNEVWGFVPYRHRRDTCETQSIKKQHPQQDT